MILGVVFLVAANVAIILASLELVRRYGTGQGSVDAVLFLLFRISLISLAILLAGVTGTLTPLGIGLPALALLVFLLVRRTYRGISLRLPFRVGPLLGCFTLLVLVRLLLQVWFFSPHLGDATNYYLPKIAEWIRAGAFTREMGIHPHVTFPAGLELVETWWVVFLHHDVLIELGGVEFLLLGCTATFALGKYLALSDRAAFLAALIYGMTPGLHLAATSCLNDVPAAGVILATAVLVVVRVPLALTALSCGVGLGVKPTFGYAIPGLLVLAYLARADPRVETRSKGVHPFALGGSIVLGGFWYARNALWFGNPFYPVGSAEKPIFLPPQFGPKFTSLRDNFLDLINVRIYDRHAYGALVDDSTGWGVVAFGLGFVALAIGLRSDPRLRKLAAGFAVSLLSVLLMIIHDPWCLKYIFFFPALLAVAIGKQLEGSRGIRMLVGVGLCLEFVGTILPFDLSAKDVRVLAAQSWRARSAVTLSGSPIPKSPVAFYGGIEGRAYLYYRPDYSQQIFYCRSHSLESLRNDITRAKVELVYAAPATEEQHAILEEAVRHGFLHPLEGRFYQCIFLSQPTQ